MRWLGRRLLDLVAFLAIGWLFKSIWTRLLAAPLWLTEDAVVGWINEQIARALGIKAPDAIQVGQWTWEWGLPLLAAAMILGGYHIIVRRRYTAPATAPQNINLVRAQTNLTNIQKPSTFVRDVNVSEAIGYIVFGKWGKSFFDAASSKEVDGASEYDKFLQAAADGHVTVWGKQSEWGVHEPIEKEFWYKNRIEWFSLLKDEPYTESSQKSFSGEKFFSLMTSRSQVEQTWPSRSTRNGVTQNADWILDTAIGLRDEIIRGRLNANDARWQNNRYDDMVNDIATQEIDAADLMNVDKGGLNSNQVQLLTKFQVRVRETNQLIRTAPTWNRPKKKIAASLLSRLRKLNDSLDELIRDWNS